MKDTRRAWVEAYREARGPSPEAVERIAARLQELGPLASVRPVRAASWGRGRTVSVAAAAVLAAAWLGLWIGRVELAHEEAERVRIEAMDRAARESREGAARRVDIPGRSSVSPRAAESAPRDGLAASSPGEGARVEAGSRGDAERDASSPGEGARVEAGSRGDAERDASSPGDAGSWSGLDVKRSDDASVSRPPAQPPGASPKPPAGAPGSLPERAGAGGQQSLSEELAWLQRAQHELQQGNFSRVLDTLTVYRAKFPRGALSEEAEAARTMAECALEPARAQARARAFAARYPRSLFTTQVLAHCTSSPPAGHP